MGQERLLRFPQADLSRHLALGRRSGRARRRARRAHAAQGRLLREADRQRDLAVELHPHQSGTVPRDRRLERREPGARHAACWPRTSRPARATSSCGRPTIRSFEVGRNIATTPGKVVGRSDVAEIIQYAADDRDGAEAAAADLPALDQQVLHPRPQPAEIASSAGRSSRATRCSSSPGSIPDERHGNKGWEAYIREGVQYGARHRREGDRRARGQRHRLLRRRHAACRRARR